jgi:hypothetical protein
VNDNNLDTSWFTATGACPITDGGVNGGCPGSTIHVDVELNMPRTVGRVKLFGSVVYGADVVTSRGGEPNGDVDHALGAPVSCVKTVRVILKTGEGDGPGLAEVGAYAN